MKIPRRCTALLLIVAPLVLMACGGYKIKPNMSAEDRFALAKRMFDNEDYLEARTQFRILALNNPAAPFIDQVQYYLGECHFQMKEYILAADEYRRLTRLYPQSELVDDAQFKVALCAFELSPKSSLDQKYTRDAIKHLQRFLEEFPNSEHVPRAEKMLTICRTKLAEKEFKIAELYRKLDDCAAALIYLDSILESYYDTEFADDALYRKGECLIKLERPEEAYQTLSSLVTRFPNSEFRPDARERIRELVAEHEYLREADGQSRVGKQTKN